MSSAADVWPALPLDSWRATYDTLHMWTQVVETRLALAPAENHWWQVALYLTPRGLTTSPMPLGNRTFAVDFDFIDHHLYVRTSDGAVGSLALVPRSVAEFFGADFDLLHSLQLSVTIYPVPVEVETAIPFAADREHAAYDADAAQPLVAHSRPGRPCPEAFSRGVRRQVESGALFLGRIRPGGDPFFRAPGTAPSGWGAELSGVGDGAGVHP